MGGGLWVCTRADASRVYSAIANSKLVVAAIQNRILNLSPNISALTSSANRPAPSASFRRPLYRVQPIAI